MKWPLLLSIFCLLILMCPLPYLQLNASCGLVQVEGFRAHQLSGRNVDIYTQKEPSSGRGTDQPSDAFATDEEVILYANVTYNGAPLHNRIVVFEVNGPLNHVENISFFRTTLTGANGVANFSFRIPRPLDDAKDTVFGFWNATATVEIAQVQVKDSLSFQVGLILEILSVETADAANASKTVFRRGEQIYFQVRVKSIALTQKVATLIISTYDNANVSIGHVILKDQSVPPGVTTCWSEGLLIPKWAFIGVGAAYATAFTALPAAGGAPWSPPVSTTFQIRPEALLLPVELYWFLILILIALVAAVLVGFIIRRRRRRKRNTSSALENTKLGKPYKHYAKRAKAKNSSPNSYICPSCGPYHLPWRKSGSE